MKSYSLAAYQLQVHAKRQKPEPLGKFGEGHNLPAVFQSFLESLNTAPAHDQVEQRLLRLEALKGQGNALFGVLESGSYGTEQKVYDRRTLQMASRIGKDHAVLKDFFFRVDLPPTSDRGLLLLLREGNVGIQHVFSKALGEYFSQRCKDATLRIEPLAPEEVVQHFSKPDRVQKVRYVLHKLAKDGAEKLDKGSNAFDGYIEVSFHANRNGALPFKEWYEKAVQGDHQPLPGMASFLNGIEPDEIKVQVEVGNSVRTVNVSNPSHIRSAFDITSELWEMNPAGPTFLEFARAGNTVAQIIGRRWKQVFDDVQQIEYPDHHSGSPGNPV